MSPLVGAQRAAGRRRRLVVVPLEVDASIGAVPDQVPIQSRVFLLTVNMFHRPVQKELTVFLTAQLSGCRI